MASTTSEILFEKDGANIYCKVPIEFAEAALGVDIIVPTLDSHAKLQIPAGTQTGTIFRIQGKGLPLPDGKGRGDQLVRIVVRTPTDLNERQIRLLEELEEQKEQCSR